MYPQRRQRLVRFLDEQDLDALVLRRPSSVAWAAEGARTYIDVTGDVGVAWLVITRGGTRVITSRIEAERLAAEELTDPAYEWTVLDWLQDAATEVPTGTDLTLLPEDVVKLESDVTSSSEGEQLAQLARALDSTVVVGLVQDVSATRFRNFVKAWSPTGAPGPEYTKNQRVPYGEWIPFRSVIEKVADVGAVPRDATVGHGPGVLDTDAGS